MTEVFFEERDSDARETAKEKFDGDKPEFTVS
jgi:hypothetical protein